MADGDIIGPVGGLIGLGIVALAAKGVIDIVKEQKEKDMKKRKQPLYQEPRVYAPRIESQDRVQRGLDKMLGR